MIRRNQQIGRNDPCPCGSGKKYKRCCGTKEDPIQVNVKGNVVPLNAILDSVAYHRRLAYLGSIGRKRKAFCVSYTDSKRKTLELVARAQTEEAKALGKSISCHKGCSFCCDEIIPITLQESEAIVFYLYQNEIALNTFIMRYPTWFNQASKHQDILTRIAQAKNRLFFEGSGTIEQMQKTVRVEARSFWDLHIHCPFLVDRSCSIYEVRPLVCACIYSVDPAEYCDPSSKIEPQIRSLIARTEKPEIYFWDDRLKMRYEDVLPNVVFNTLTGGFKYLSEVPGLGQLYQDFCRDSEVPDRIQ